MPERGGGTFVINVYLKNEFLCISESEISYLLRESYNSKKRVWRLMAMVTNKMEQI